MSRAVPALLLALALSLGAGASDQQTGAGGVPVGPSLEIGRSIHVNGVTVFPVVDHAADDLFKDGFLTMREAIRGGALHVGEGSGGGEVATITVVNRSKLPVFAQAGEVIKGGNQDRVIAEDVVIPPSPRPMLLSVNCVEQGRWQAKNGGRFDYGGRAESALRRVVQVERDQSATWEAVAALNSGKATTLLAAGHADAASWLAPTSGTYSASLETRAVVERTRKTVAEILPRLAKEHDVVGVVVAVGGRIVASDVYGHPDLFARVREEAVASYVLDAVTQLGPGDVYVPPSSDDAAWFLRDALAAVEISETPGKGGFHEELEGAKTRSFRFREADGDLLHMSVYVD